MKNINSHLQRTLFHLILKLQPKGKQESGYVIVVVMGMIIAMGSMLITAALTSKVDTNSTKYSANSATGFYAAEAGLNLRAKDIRATFVGYNRPSGSSPSDWLACRDATSGNDGSGAFVCDNSKTFQGQPVSTFVLEDLNNPSSVTINQNELFGGLNAQEYRYDVTSVAFDSESQPTASLQMRFKSRLVPLFQFAVFYQQDLDFTYPPNMTMSGPIHSNSNIYLNSASDFTLTLKDQLTTAGQLFRGERTTTSCTGTVTVFDPNPAPGLQQPLACGSGNDRKEYLQTDVASWDQYIQVGVPALTLPPVNDFDATPGRDYWDKADLRIVLNLDSSENPTGIEVQTAAGGTDNAATNALLGNTCAPTTTTLSSNPTTADVALGVANSTNFRLTDTTRDLKDGPALQLEPSGTTNYVNNTAIDNDENIVINARSSNTAINLQKQLGKAFAANSVVRKATVWTSNTFWNYREKTNPSTPDRNDAKQIRMLNVDMQALMTCANQLMGGKNINDTTEGGLVWFFTVRGPNSNNNVTTGGASNTYGIRLYNGGALASTDTSHPAIQGLTIVSDQAVYVRGDYNVTNKKPASIMADTINVLSNNWPLDDSYSRAYSSGLQNTSTPVYIYSYDYGDSPGRLASNTAINVAFLAGIDLTGGGVNNYPRLHEDWYDPSTGNRYTLSYRGSMVSLGSPRRVNGPFCGSGTTTGTGNCNIYTPPIRNWDYDTDFNDAAKLPPLSPRFVYLRQERFSRDFNRQSLRPFPSHLPSLLRSNFTFALPASMHASLSQIFN